MTTSSVELQAPLVIVQRKVTGLSSGTKVMSVLYEPGVEIEVVPAEPTMLQTPDPDDGLFPAKVKVDVLHND